MQLKNSVLINFVLGMNSLREKKLPIKLSFAIKYNLDLVAPAISAFNSARDEIVQGGANPEEELNKLLEEEVELAIKTVSAEDLERTESENRFDVLTLRELEALSFMIEG